MGPDTDNSSTENGNRYRKSKKVKKNGTRLENPTQKMGPDENIQIQKMGPDTDNPNIENGARYV